MGVRERKPRVDGITAEELASLVTEDLTAAQIAERLGRSLDTIRHWLHRHGLQTTEQARRTRKVLPRVEARCDSHGTTEHVTRADGQQVCLRCQSEAVTRWRRRTKQRLIDEAGGSCVICGFDTFAAALHFHHVDPSSKRFAIGARGLTRSLEVLREEAAKCVLLCANCHAGVEVGEVELPASATRDTMSRTPNLRG